MNRETLRKEIERLRAFEGAPGGWEDCFLHFDADLQKRLVEEGDTTPEPGFDDFQEWLKEFENHRERRGFYKAFPELKRG